MSKDIAKIDENPFEQIRKEDENGEYWLARDMQIVLGYKNWQNFIQAMKRAAASCKHSGVAPGKHAIKVNRMVDVGSGAKREIVDYRLTRYMCYIIGMNGDPFKEEVAKAQMYFAIRTREAEVMQERLVALQSSEVTQILGQLSSIQADMLSLSQEAEKRGFEKAVQAIIGGKNIKELRWTPD